MERVIVRYLSILKASKKRFSFPRWNHFFSPPISTAALGKELQQAREEKKISTAQVATMLHCSEAVIIALEKGECYEGNALFYPGYFRLIAVDYARLLGLDLKKIHPLLPPPAPLQSTTFIKKLSPLQQQPRKPHFMRQEQQLTYSLGDVRMVLWKFFKIVVVLVALFYFWNLVRHLARVVF